MTLLKELHQAINSGDTPKAVEIAEHIVFTENEYPKSIIEFAKSYLEKFAFYNSPLPLLQEMESISAFEQDNPDHHLLDASTCLPVIETATEHEEEFIDYAPVELPPRPFKTIAFYLPQFHPFPENDLWWGKGFTEWTNVGKAVPAYQGHHQPHCPIHFGYYDLRIVGNMVEQARLAKEYGIDAFSYYFYWFNGKTLMETPLINMLNEPAVNIDFCLTWANENWTRRWDGQENDILISQHHSEEDSEKLIIHLLPYFRDTRYIKVNNCPVFIVYRPDIIPQVKKVAELWRSVLRREGFDGLYLIAAQTFGLDDPEPIGFDAAVEFPPHAVGSPDLSQSIKSLRSNFSGHIYSYKEVVFHKFNELTSFHYKKYFTAMLSWDNSARKGDNAHIFWGFTLKLYKRWLRLNIKRTLSDRRLADDNRFLFINAWNEWAEGTHLEPDRKYGYGYLDATATVLCEYASNNFEIIRGQHDPRLGEPNKRGAIFIHAYYINTFKEIADKLEMLDLMQIFDIFVTTDTIQKALEIKQIMSSAIVDIHENRGRDILPFIETLRSIHHLSYEVCLKLHTKQSLYREDGQELFNLQMNSLLPSKQGVIDFVNRIVGEPMLGAIVPKNSLLEHNYKNMKYNWKYCNQLSSEMGIDFTKTHFPAGSMFWFKQSALPKLLMIQSKNFADELGLSDGTAAHAVERLFLVAMQSIGFRYEITAS